LGSLLESNLKIFYMGSSSEAVFSEAQVAVIGAGIIGCSVAYHLARRGASVVVTDANGIGTGTSSATLGLVWVQRKEPAEYMELNLLSSKLHAELANTFDEDVELEQSGGLSSYLDEETYYKQLGAMERLNAASKKHQARSLTPIEARELEPELSLDIVGAIYSQLDGAVNPIKLVFNLARTAKELGATFLTHTPALRIDRNDAGVTGVDTPKGFIRAKTVVVTAGAGTSSLVESLGIDLPMVFEKGQLLVTEALPQLVKYPTGNTRQTKRGNILLGTTYEANQTERITTKEGAYRVANDSLRRFPVLKDIHIIRHFAGVRPLPKDGKPYLGPVKRVPGLYIAVSHSGITLAPVHGKVISELILDGKTDIPLELYRPERFMPDNAGTSG
jgi:glycine/D-amino acid oxidase-like deaminating enzyme